MRVSVNREIHAVQIWCTEAEAEAPDFKEKSELIREKYRTSDKDVLVIYQSGKQDLFTLTADLLRHNKYLPTSASKSESEKENVKDSEKPSILEKMEKLKESDQVAKNAKSEKARKASKTKKSELISRDK